MPDASSGRVARVILPYIQGGGVTALRTLKGAVSPTVDMFAGTLVATTTTNQ